MAPKSRLKAAFLVPVRKRGDSRHREQDTQREERNEHVPHEPELTHIVYLSLRGNDSLAVVKSHLVTRSKQTEGAFNINGQRFMLTRLTFDGHDRIIRHVARDFWLLQCSPERVAHLREGVHYEWVHPRRGKTMLDRYSDRESKELFAHAKAAVFHALGRDVSVAA